MSNYEDYEDEDGYRNKLLFPQPWVRPRPQQRTTIGPNPGAILNRAAASGWKGFHRLDCGAFYGMTGEEEERDARALLDFWRPAHSHFDIHEYQERATNHLSEEH